MSKRRSTKNDGSIGELLILLLIGWLAYQLTFTNNIYDAGHKAFIRIGVDEIIHELDSQMQN